MARGYKRLTRKARHIIRNLKHTKHASVQNQMIHELRHEVSRTHGFRGPGKAPDLGKAGRWRPLTHKAKQILARLRKAKVWSVQKRLVTELAKEIERGKRVADRARQAAKRAQARAKAAARRTRAGARRTAQGARATGRAGRWTWRKAAPRAARSVRTTRRTVVRAQERLLTRAERRQSERERGTRKLPVTARVARRMRSLRPARLSAPQAASRVPSPRGRLAPGAAPATPARASRGHSYEHDGVQFRSNRKMKPGEVRSVARQFRELRAAKAAGRTQPGGASRSSAKTKRSAARSRA